MDNIDKIFIGLSVLEAVALIILLIQKYASRNAVLLEPGKDRLRVDYYWLDEKKLREGATPTVDDLATCMERYEYTVEGTEVLVSRQQSLDVTSERGVNDESDDSGSSSARVIAIRPPVHLRRPPAVLMAIEISVV